MVPRFQSRAASAVQFDRVRVTLSRLAPGSDTVLGLRAGPALGVMSSGPGPIALDTTVDFPPGADSLALRLSVPITGGSEDLLLDLWMINAAGDTVFRGGPDIVTATDGTAGSETPVTVAVRYVGVGANARSVRIATRSATLFFRDSVTLTATALDADGQAIPGTPIAWRSLDARVAIVPDETIGKVVGGTARGVARIEAMLPTSLADTAQVTVQPVPAALGIVSGNGQSGTVGTALAQPLVVRVKAADNLAVQGVAVTFRAASGSGSVSKATDTTAATGNAGTAWTLGTAPGSQSATATVAGFPALTVTLGASGAVGPVRQLAFQVQPPSTVAANVPVAPAVQVAAQDTFGNAVTGYTGNVTLAIGTNPGGSTLGGASTAAAVAGVATFDDLTLNLPGTGYTLVASATGLAGATGAGFNVTGGVPTQLVVIQQPSDATGGATIAPAVAVEVRDANGNVVPTATNAVTLAFGANPGGGTLGGTTTRSAVAGVATFGNLTIDKVGAGYTLRASAGGLADAISAGFSIAAGAASRLAFTQQPSSVAAGATMSPPVAVTVQDAQGNVATAASGTVSLALTAPGGALLAGAGPATVSSGVATFSGLSVNKAGTYTVTPTTTVAGVATLPASGSFAVTAGTVSAAQSAVAAAPLSIAAGGAGSTITVTARDANGNPVGGATVVLAATGTGNTLTQPVGTTNASGVATGTLSLDRAPSRRRCRRRSTASPSPRRRR